jgi:hypothetical protein
VEGSRERAEAREGGGARLNACLGVRAPAEEVKRNKREGGDGKEKLRLPLGRDDVIRRRRQFSIA